MNKNIILLKNKVKCLSWKIIANLGLSKENQIPIKFIVENADWAIKFVGENIKRELDIIAPRKVEVSSKPYRFVENIVHFGSQYMWLNWSKYMSNENQYIASFFHGKPQDGEEVKTHIDLYCINIYI